MEKVKKTYEISSFEVDVKGFLRIRSLFNLFQDMADFHADQMGLGYDFCSKNGIGWVGGAYHLQVNRLPKWRDKIVIETWPSGATAACGIRDFQVKTEYGYVLINATSQWVLVDINRMRPVPVAKHLPDYDIIDDHAFVSDFSKFQLPEKVATEFTFPVHTDDIDLNNHVNNALYPTWCMDGLDDEFLNTHSIQELQVNFKRPAKKGDTVVLHTSYQLNETLHLLLSSDLKTEYARVKIVWQAQ